MKTQIFTFIIACASVLLTSCGTMSEYSGTNMYEDGIYYSYNANKRVDKTSRERALNMETRQKYNQNGNFLPRRMPNKLSFTRQSNIMQGQTDSSYYYGNYQVDPYNYSYYGNPYSSNINIDLWGNYTDPWYYDGYYYPYSSYYFDYYYDPYYYYYPYRYRYYRSYPHRYWSSWYDPYYYDPYYYDPYYYDYYYDYPYYYRSYYYYPYANSRENLGNNTIWGSRNSSYQNTTYVRPSSTNSDNSYVSRSYRRDNSVRNNSGGNTYYQRNNSMSNNSSSYNSSNRTYSRSSSSGYSGSSSSYSRSSSGYSRSSSGYSRNGSTYSRSRR